MKKLKWIYDGKYDTWESDDGGIFSIGITPTRGEWTTKEQIKNKFQLFKKDVFIGYFKTVLRAKKVAQLIHNG